MNHLANLNCQLSSHYEQYSNHVNTEICDVFSVQRHPIMYLKPGYILRVKLEGFLTHKHKVIDFTHPITLIHGTNGSGKSSILQGLHFVLLGNHTQIRDGIKSFQEFKMRGTGKNTDGINDLVVSSQSSVTVYFNKPYILRRTITGTDTKFYYGDFTEKTTRMKAIPKKQVALLLQELQHFPNNKVTTVTQHEMKIQARMAANQRFSLFYSASMLSDIVQTYEETYTHVQNIYDNIKHLHTRCAKKQQEKITIDKKIQKNQQIIRNLADAAKFNIYKKSIDYFFLLFNILRQKGYIITKQQDEHAIQQSIANYNMQLNNMELQREQQKQQLENTMRNIEKMEAKKQKISENVTKAQLRCQQHHLDLQMKKDTIKQYRSKGITLEKAIEKCQQLLLKKEEIQAQSNIYSSYNLDLPEELIILKQNIINKEKQEQELRQQENKIKHQLNDVMMQISGYNTKKVNFESELELHEKQLELLRTQLQNKQNQQNNKQQIINNLNNEDKQTHNFIKQHSLKIYLVSAEIYLETRDERIQSAIQRYLFPQSIGFLCFTESGKQECEMQFNKQSPEYFQFQTIKSKYQIQTQVNTIKFQSIMDRLKQLKDDKLTQIYYLPDILKVSNDICMTALVLQRRIDKVILINHINDARSILEHCNDAIILPLDAKTVISYQNGTITSQPLYDQPAGLLPGQSSLFCVNKNDIVEIQRQIHQKQIDIEKIKIQLSQFENDITTITNLEKSKDEYQEEIKSIMNKCQDILLQIQNEKSTVEPLQKKYDKENSEFQKERQKWLTLYDEVQEAQDQIKKYTDQLDRNATTIEKIELEIKTLSEQQDNSDKYELESYQQELKLVCDDLDKQYSMKSDIIDNLDLINNGKVQEQLNKTIKELGMLQQLITGKKNELESQSRKVIKELISIEQYLATKKNMMEKFLGKHEAILNYINTQNTQDLIISVMKILIKEFDSNKKADQIAEKIDDLQKYFQLQQQTIQESQEYTYSLSYNDALLSDDIKQFSEILTLLQQHIQNIHVEIQNKLIELEKNYISMELTDEGTLNELIDDMQRCNKDIERIMNEYQQNKNNLRDLIGKLARQTMNLSQLRMQCEDILIYQFSKNMKIMGLNASLSIKLPPLPTLESYGLDPTDVLAEQQLIRYQQYTKGINMGINAQKSDNTKEFLNGSVEIKVNDRSVTTLSGGEGTRTALGFITACCNVIQSAYLQIDEWDVYLDAEKRTAAFSVLLNVISNTNLQCVFVTPNDVDISDKSIDMEAAKLVGVVRLQSVIRNAGQ